MTIPVLRPFQRQLRDDVYDAWSNGAKNVVMRLDTGGGKTVTLADIVRSHLGASCVIAHRQELVAQLSLTLARYGVRHNLIASDKVKRHIARLHVKALGYSLFDPGAPCCVASIDTLIRAQGLGRWAATVTLWVTDEGHHLVLDNKWHKGISLFTNPAVRGLLPTATPVRGDRKGLGRAPNGDGVADVMVEGPPMRWLIDNGYLSDYRIFCPPSDLVVLGDVAASGDWSSQQLRDAAKRSHIIGDVVDSYLKYGGGHPGITFSTDVETAGATAAAYRRAGVSAEVLTGDTDDFVRQNIMRRLETGELQQLVAVDVVSEGVDVPAVVVVTFARPTASLSLYMQQWRNLRPLAGKPKAIVIDHAGNVVRHNGPPDRPRVWSLARQGAKSRVTTDADPMRVCLACFEPYRAIFKACPACGHYEPPASRSSPASVSGDLSELSPETLAALRKNIDDVDMPIETRRGQLQATGLPHAFVMSHVKAHSERQDAQAILRYEIALWGGKPRAEGLTDSEIQRKFFFTFGISVVEAMALGTREALALADKINA